MKKFSMLFFHSRVLSLGLKFFSEHFFWEKNFRYRKLKYFCVPFTKWKKREREWVWELTKNMRENELKESEISLICTLFCFEILSKVVLGRRKNLVLLQAKHIYYKRLLFLKTYLQYTRQKSSLDFYARDSFFFWGK